MSAKDPNAHRPGYKNTKVGWIPEDWACVQAGDLCEIQLGKMLSGKAKQGVAPAPYLANYNVRWGTFILNDLQRMDFDDRERKKFLLKRGDLLVCEGGEVGRCAVWKDQVAQCYYQKALHRVRPIHNSLNTSYLMYHLHRAVRHPRMAHFIGESSIAHFTREQFLKFPILLPPLPEQRKIAEILSTCDAVIEKTGELIAAKKRRKQALMQQLLTGKKRLPGFKATNGRSKYRFFDLPTDWKCLQVSDVACERNVRNGKNESHIVLSCSKHLGFIESTHYFNKQVFSEDTSKYKIVRRKWFGFPSNHVEEGSIGLLRSHESGIVSPIYVVFETNDKIFPEYLYAVFKTEMFRHIFSVTTNASVDRRGSLKWAAFSSIQIPCPGMKEQKAIAHFISTAQKEINALEAKFAALKQQKKALMQKLLTGQVRVKVPTPAKR